MNTTFPISTTGQWNSSVRSAGNDREVSFALYAPFNSAVQLVGDFNNWKPIDMRRAEDGWWRTGISVPDGEYRYWFSVKSNSYIGSGQMVTVLDPAAFPASIEGQECSLLHIRQGRRITIDYRWEHDLPFPLSRRGLSTYELRADDSINRIIRELEPLANLGVNSIVMIPSRARSARSRDCSPHALMELFAEFGSPKEICRFVDECHANRMRVLMSIDCGSSLEPAVLQHVAYDYWLDELHIDDALVVRKPKHDFTQFHPKLGMFPVHEHMMASIRFWIATFHLDGVRFDQAAPVNTTSAHIWTSPSAIEPSTAGIPQWKAAS